MMMTEEFDERAVCHFGLGKTSSAVRASSMKAADLGALDVNKAGMRHVCCQLYL